MGFRFNKSINLGKGIKLNISKSGIGFSVGKSVGNTSFRVGRTAKGKTRVTGTLKGTGVSYVKEFTDPLTQAVKDKEKEKKKTTAKTKKEAEPVEETVVVEEASSPVTKMTTSQRIAARKAAEEQARREAEAKENPLEGSTLAPIDTDEEE